MRLESHDPSAARRARAFFLAVAIGALLGCEVSPAEPVYSALATSKTTGTLRIATPGMSPLGERPQAVIRACTGSNCYALIASLRLEATTPTDVVLPSGDYSLQIMPPSGYALQGTPGSEYQLIRVVPEQITTATYGGTLVSIVPYAPPASTFGTLRVQVSGLGAEVADGGSIDGASEVYRFGPVLLPKTGIAEIPVPVGHWMDHYYWLQYKPPTGYVVPPGDSARFEVWFIHGDSSTTWQVSVVKSK